MCGVGCRRDRSESRIEGERGAGKREIKRNSRKEKSVDKGVREEEKKGREGKGETEREWKWKRRKWGGKNRSGLGSNPFVVFVVV